MTEKGWHVWGGKKMGTRRSLLCNKYNYMYLLMRHETQVNVDYLEDCHVVRHLTIAQ